MKVPVKKETREFAERLMQSVAMHVDETYGEDVDENLVGSIEGELINAIDDGLQNAWERAE